MATHVSIVKGGSLIDPALNVRVLTFVNPYQPDRFPPELAVQHRGCPALKFVDPTRS